MGRLGMKFGPRRDKKFGKIFLGLYLQGESSLGSKS